jgi:UDP-GlcNAc:undecaprenyl-phosphate/decaprenyl-phosphate GlcNAc-1-phosphate transferase
MTMSSAVSATVGFAIALAVACAATPAAIAVARMTDFLDRPREYRQHARPTAFLGGAAVLAGFLTSALVLGVSGKLLVPVGCAAGMWLLGTVDDRVAVAPRWRVLVEVVAGVAVFEAGLGWSTAAGQVVNLFLTVAWIVGLVNAFNLMDNLDGACGTVAAVACAGIGALAVVKGHALIAGLAFALSGACVGFLPWNLAGPAKVFLGDGGSMPLGFLVAALAMATVRHASGGNAGLLAGALLCGLPILDVTLVTVSRTRRGVSLLTGGRDHLTHRILLAVGSPRMVALALAFGQGLLCSLAILGYEFGAATLASLALAVFVAGLATVLQLDTAAWRPPGIAFGRPVKAEAPVLSGSEPVAVDTDPA